MSTCLMPGIWTRDNEQIFSLKATSSKFPNHFAKLNFIAYSPRSKYIFKKLELT
eukprot:TRINITY_DN499_c0_g1_i1.p1 TRINITY_DN499_c0_g1~~TRINITY_DN499_c0_g1_i1.p1  ORF type:complete len:54 (-),score=2.21 TRINITY_DN499_c0_g1_i1:190-351(-)